MPANFLKKRTRFAMSPIDKAAFDPATTCINDIQWWAQLYDLGTILPWQAYFYHYPAKDKVCSAGVRVGKSYGIALQHSHYGMFHNDRRVLNTSISSEQAKIVYYNMLQIFSHPKLQHWVEHIERSPYPLIRLINGTEYWYRSIGYEAELIRGWEFDWINVDEAGYVRSQMTMDTLVGRLLGVNPKTGMPRDAIFTQISSPKGKIGPFFDRWKKGDPRYPGADPLNYLSLRVRTSENILLSEEQIMKIMEQYTERTIRQELMGEFLDDTSIEFAMDDIIHCCSDLHGEVRGLLQDIREWQGRQGIKTYKSVFGLEDGPMDLEHYELEPRAGHQYICSWDLGKKPQKGGRNATVGMVWDVTELPWKMVAFRYESGSTYIQAMGWIEQWHVKYSSAGTTAYTVIDASGKGDVLNEIIEAENRISVEGIVYSNQLKPNLITSGKLAIERDMVRFPMIQRMVDELAGYTLMDKDIPQDIVMTFCQAMHKAREITGIIGPNLTTTSNGLTNYRRSNLGMSSSTSRYAERRRASIHLRSGRAG